MQKVLNTPCGKSMLLYYSRKIAVYNFTVYESQTKNGFCFVWDETQGKKGSNEICTSLMKYLTTIEDIPEIETISLYCDNCNGQNKNKQILIMLHTFLKKSKHIKEITLNYLMAGHTYMPADSIHSTIDSFIKNKIIYAPSQWATVISLSRHNPKPYHVSSLTYKDIKNWVSFENDSKCLPSHSVLKGNENPQQSENPDGLEHEDVSVDEYKSIPGSTRKRKRAGKGTKKCNVKNNSKRKKIKEVKGKSLKISQVRSITFKKDSMFVRYSYIDDCADEQEFKFKPCCENTTLKKAYSERIHISTLKYKDLEKLCKKKTIPEEYHKEFLSLKHSNNVNDFLQDTDEEDEVIEVTELEEPEAQAQ